MLHAAMWGRGDIDQVDGDEIVNQEIMVVPEVTSNQSFKQKMKALLVKSYPWIHSAHEGNFFKMCTRVYFPKERNRINIFFSMMRPNLTNGTKSTYHLVCDPFLRRGLLLNTFYVKIKHTHMCSPFLVEI